MYGIEYIQRVGREDDLHATFAPFCPLTFLYFLVSDEQFTSCDLASRENVDGRFRKKG
jgi:hypothetical protein